MSETHICDSIADLTERLIAAREEAGWQRKKREEAERHRSELAARVEQLEAIAADAAQLHDLNADILETLGEGLREADEQYLKGRDLVAKHRQQAERARAALAAPDAAAPSGDSVCEDAPAGAGGMHSNSSDEHTPCAFCGRRVSHADTD